MADVIATVQHEPSCIESEIYYLMTITFTAITLIIIYLTMDLL